jgi:hypothetical protein
MFPASYQGRKLTFDTYGTDSTLQTGLGGKTEFSGLGLLGMRLGVQPFMTARWQDY